MNLAIAMRAMGDLPGARTLVPRQVAGMRARVLSLLALAPRQAREAVGAEAYRLGGVLFLTESAGPELRSSVFELQETMRVVATEAARAIERSNDPEIEALMGEARSVRAALNDLISSSNEERNSEELSSELTALIQERDRLEREASRRLAESGVVTRPIEVGPLAEALPTDAAAVGYGRITAWEQDEETGSGNAPSERRLPGGAAPRSAPAGWPRGRRRPCPGSRPPAAAHPRLTP